MIQTVALRSYLNTKLFLVAAISLAPCVQLEAESSSVSAELKQVVDELNERQLWLDESDDFLRQLQRDLQSMDLKIASTSSELRSLQGDISAIEARIGALELEQSRSQDSLREQSDTIAWHLQQSYKSSRTHWLRDLLSTNADVRFRDRIAYYHRSLAETEADRLVKFLDDIRKLQASTQSLQTERDTLAQKRAEVADKNEDFTSTKERYNDQIQKFNREVSETKREVRKLEGDRTRLMALLTELARYDFDENASLPNASTQSFAPTSEAPESTLRATHEDVEYNGWPILGEIEKRFGEPRAGGRLRWEGVQISAEPGTVVRAIASGTVVFADWLQGYGMLVIVKSSDGTDAIYGNCEMLLRKVGDDVEAGEGIAIVGQSGGQTKTGLYFEIRVNNKPLDPIAWLDSR